MACVWAWKRGPGQAVQWLFSRPAICGSVASVEHLMTCTLSDRRPATGFFHVNTSERCRPACSLVAGSEDETPGSKKQARIRFADCPILRASLSHRDSTFLGGRLAG
ncbi:MAG: hypothetical protein BJ554DRAFT_5642 [Olpidium bornovanus]|uniref:Uncharacterized protein n=1 Tax=Olpidium bornovanus TaxID=278681 RepID=A0A8H8DKN6_9FUNG|nr:MAG: hypothetical protein BJ554DRAFT_5642 [Olpidium bornovanus]